MPRIITGSKYTKRCPWVLRICTEDDVRESRHRARRTALSTAFSFCGKRPYRWVAFFDKHGTGTMKKAEFGVGAELKFHDGWTP